MNPQRKPASPFNALIVTPKVEKTPSPTSWWSDPTVQTDRAAFRQTAEKEHERQRTAQWTPTHDRGFDR